MDIWGLVKDIHSAIIGGGGITAIYNLLTAQLVLTETGGTVTLDGTEQDVYRVDVPYGTFKPCVVQIDFTNQTIAETVVIREKYRIAPGGDYIVKDELTLVGVQSPELIGIALEENRFGVVVTIERTAGGAIAYDWDILANV